MDISFSIVIPLYNKEKEIGDTIRCVLNQTFTHYELIVVDDGSTDNSIGVVNSFNDNRIKLYQKNNDGVSSARNFGIQHARFDFIAFLDADDFWNETYLLKMQDLILQHPDCGMFSSLYQYKIGNDFEIPKFPNLSKSKHKIRINNYFKYSLKSPLINSSNVVIPKSVLAEVGGFNEDLVHGEDLEMWLKIANIYPFVIQLEYLSFYLINASNRACNSMPTYNKSIVSILHKYEHKNKNYYRRAYLNKIRLDFLSQFLHANIKTDFKSLHKDLKVYNLKSLVFKVLPYKYLRLITRK